MNKIKWNLKAIWQKVKRVNKEEKQNIFFYQAEDGIRNLVRSRGLGDVYKRQEFERAPDDSSLIAAIFRLVHTIKGTSSFIGLDRLCLLYTSDAADERSSVDLGGRRIIKKKTQKDERKPT